MDSSKGFMKFGNFTFDPIQCFGTDFFQKKKEKEKRYKHLGACL